jgi:hypothetical protein
LNWSIDWETIENLELIGIDEILVRFGHKDFLTLITDSKMAKLKY